MLTIALILTLLPGVVSMTYAAAGIDEGNANFSSGSGDKIGTEAMTGILVLLAVGTRLTSNGYLYKNDIEEDFFDG